MTVETKKGTVMQRSVRAILCALLLTAVSLPAHAQEKQTIRFKVTKDGLVTSDVKMEEKKITIPKGVRVRLVFDYADRNGNAHQFRVHSAQTEMTAQRITADGPKTSAVEFTVGERGEEFYRISCDLPCLAMEELTDYLLFVGQKT
jgi:hypothetical protein